MNAKALICDEQQNFALTEVVLNDPAPDQVAIRTHFTGVSIGTEFGLISGKISKMNRNPFPLCNRLSGHRHHRSRRGRYRQFCGRRRSVLSRQ